MHGSTQDQQFTNYHPTHLIYPTILIAGLFYLHTILQRQHCCIQDCPLCHHRLSVDSQKLTVRLLPLKSNDSHPRDVEMSDNYSFQDSGVKPLCTGLGSPNCKLDTLRSINVFYSCIMQCPNLNP